MSNYLVQNNIIEKYLLNYNTETMAYEKVFRDEVMLLFGKISSNTEYKTNLYNYLLSLVDNERFWAKGHRAYFRKGKEVYASYEQIHRFVGGSNSKIYDALRDLIKKGLIIQNGANAKNQNRTKAHYKSHVTPYGGKWIVNMIDESQFAFEVKNACDTFWHSWQPFLYSELRFLLGDNYRADTKIKIIRAMYLENLNLCYESRRECMRYLDITSYNYFNSIISEMQRDRLLGKQTLDMKGLYAYLEKGVETFNKYEEKRKNHTIYLRNLKASSFLRSAKTNAYLTAMNYIKETRGFYSSKSEKSMINENREYHYLLSEYESLLSKDYQFKLEKQKKDILFTKRRANYDTCYSPYNYMAFKTAYEKDSTSDKKLYEYWIALGAKYFEEYTQYFRNKIPMKYFQKKEYKDYSNLMDKMSKVAGKKYYIPTRLGRYLDSLAD